MYPLPRAIRSLVERGEFERALIHAERQLDHSPNHIEWLEAKARVLMEMQQYDAAAAVWRDVMAYGPVRARPHLALATCLAELESIEAAAHELETAFALDYESRECAERDVRLHAVLSHL